MEVTLSALEKVSEAAAESVRENVVAMAQELKEELSETLPTVGREWKVWTEEPTSSKAVPFWGR